MHFSTFIVKPLRPCVKSCVLSGSVFGDWGEAMQGDFNGPRAPTQSNPHAHNHTNMHAHIRSSILTHIIYAGEKYINICITKQYKGLSVIKYLWC